MPSRLFFRLVIALSIVVAFACVIYPVYVIRPFRAQGPRELAVALDVMRFRGPVLLGCLIATVAAVWFGTRRRWAAALAVLSVVAAAVLARVNIYERMFHPNMSPQFQAVSASPLAGPERVFAVKVNGKARAYPVRSMSYHHILNDTVGGVPIAATY